MFLKFLSFLIIIILLVLEFERNKYPKISFKEFYDSNISKTLLISLNNAIIHLYDRRDIFDVNNYNELNILTKNQNKIKQDFLNNFPKYKITQPSVFDDTFKYDPNYGYYFLKFSNNYINENLDLFPNLKNFLLRCPSIKTCFFSIINGSKVIKTHRGPGKGYLRLHIPIINDYSNDNFLQVKNKKLYWKEKPFLFDDTFYHKLIKKDDGLRVSLICDVKRHLPYGLKQFNNIIQNILSDSDFVQEKLKKLVLYINEP